MNRNYPRRVQNWRTRLYLGSGWLIRRKTLTR